MSSPLSAIARFYDLQARREWERMDRHPTEFAVTLRALSERLPAPPAQVLDCGGGPGRYAIELARKGYDVTLFDLSDECLRLARERAAEAGAVLQGYEQGTATDLSHYHDDAFDAVLLMGPLYHLLEEDERRRALAEARRVLKPGGPLFATFISRYAVHRWYAAHEPASLVEHSGAFETILSTGVEPRGAEDGSAFIAHFAHPAEVIPLCQDVGLQIVTVLGVEGLVSMIEEGLNGLSGQAWDTWVDLNYRVAADPSIHGCVEHLLAIAVKPRWRAVLRRIARRLEELGLAYRVVGGAAAALHGVPLPVNDLDLVMDVDGVYHFQAVFTNDVVEPVSYRESEASLSHLGRFEIGGVTVEVMGDLHWQEDSEWVRLESATETTVDLDGVPVRVSWLEEQTLGYVHRGRLDRAAQCLFHCDPDRLSMLLKGERAADAL
jgi:ubiquinone/menaquinone biosynthesis C-methylase UbiE